MFAIHASPSWDSLDFEDEEPDHKIIEALLSNLEAEQAELVRAIRETKHIDASQVEHLAAFISMIRYRVPHLYSMARYKPYDVKQVTLCIFSRSHLPRAVF